MKTAISIPDDVFRDADRAASRLGWSRSQLYTKAIEAFLAEHGDLDDPVTVALDRLADEVDTGAVVNAGKELIDSGAWEW